MKKINKITAKYISKAITILLCFSALAAVLTMTACDKEDETEFTLDPQAAASDIIKNVEFGSEMQDIDIDALSIMYTVEENVQAVAYIAGGALADELVIFTAPDEAAAGKMLQNVKDHVKERSDLFADYAPSEVAKLDKAYVKQRGCYVIICVTGNIDQAKTVIDKYF